MTHGRLHVPSWKISLGSGSPWTSVTGVRPSRIAAIFWIPGPVASQERSTCSLLMIRPCICSYAISVNAAPWYHGFPASPASELALWAPRNTALHGARRDPAPP